MKEWGKVVRVMGIDMEKGRKYFASMLIKKTIIFVLNNAYEFN